MTVQEILDAYEILSEEVGAERARELLVQNEEWILIDRAEDGSPRGVLIYRHIDDPFDYRGNGNGRGVPFGRYIFIVYAFVYPRYRNPVLKRSALGRLLAKAKARCLGADRCAIRRDRRVAVFDLKRVTE